VPSPASSRAVCHALRSCERIGRPAYSRSQLATLAARDRIRTSCSNREMAEAGLLMSYGTDTLDAFRHAGVYTGQILKGAKPTDLPVVQSSKFELIINAQTARMLGLDMPPMLLARAPTRSSNETP
jgi:putative ABC transport system substrate-binding protein